MFRRTVVGVLFLALVACSSGSSERDVGFPDAREMERSDGGGEELIDGSVIPPADSGLRDSGVHVTLIPPDPRTLAPPLAAGIVPFFQQIAFLIGPVQVDVVPGAITPARAAVVRGVVRERGGGPLSGVEVRVDRAPELGRTWTRADGGFDLVVNGGGLVTLRYSLPNYLPVVRRISTTWADFAHADDVTLVPLDPAVTRIELGAMTTAAVAPGRAMTDERGARRASLIFAPGTRATLHMPDGTTRPLSAISVRSTEYTVGPDGPAAMPAPLPLATGYTYAVELSVDEAVAAGAGRVEFSTPVAVYLDDFVGIPTGEIVPVGYYDNEKGAWIGSPNGRVVTFIRVDGELATLDLDGDQAPDDDAAHVALGISAAERRALAIDRPAGARLWRAPVPHFSAWDFNYASAPIYDDNFRDVEIEENNSPNPCEKGGSILECQTRAVGQRVGVPGTPLMLEYRSRRTPAARQSSISFAATKSGRSVSPNLVAVHIDVTIAGQKMSTSYAPAAGVLGDTARSG